MSQLSGLLSLFNVMSILVNSDFGHFPQFIEIQMNKDFRHIKKQRREHEHIVEQNAKTS